LPDPGQEACCQSSGDAAFMHMQTIRLNRGGQRSIRCAVFIVTCLNVKLSMTSVVVVVVEVTMQTMVRVLMVRIRMRVHFESRTSKQHHQHAHNQQPATTDRGREASQAGGRGDHAKQYA
jgi:hypothetical protein